MALLDFIRNRDGQQQTAEPQSQQQPETAKQMYSREATVDQAAKPSDLVRSDQQARLAQAQALFSKGTQDTPQKTPAPTSAPEEGATSPQPMRQAMTGQETVAPELSPTSAQASARAQDVEAPSAPASTPAKSQQQTIARTTPSWER
jgi:hypothetical protein